MYYCRLGNHIQNKLKRATCENRRRRPSHLRRRRRPSHLRHHHRRRKQRPPHAHAAASHAGRGSRAARPEPLLKGQQGVAVRLPVRRRLVFEDAITAARWISAPLPPPSAAAAPSTAWLRCTSCQKRPWSTPRPSATRRTSLSSARPDVTSASARSSNLTGPVAAAAAAVAAAPVAASAATASKTVPADRVGGAGEGVSARRFGRAGGRVEWGTGPEAAYARPACRRRRAARRPTSTSASSSSVLALGNVGATHDDELQQVKCRGHRNRPRKYKVDLTSRIELLPLKAHLNVFSPA